MGIIELRFRLEVVGGALHYQSIRTALGFGSWRIPLPRWLGPRVVAWERPAGQRGQIDVSVEGSLPGLGRLFTYAGQLTQVERPG
jgi:hypothetical protein